MNLRLPKKDKFIGIPPGTPVFKGEKKTDKVELKLIEYSENFYSEKEIQISELLELLKDSAKIKWLIVTGLHDTKIIGQIGEIFNIKHLIIEDILDTGHHPKIDFFDNFIFIASKIIDYNETSKTVHSEHLSLLFGKDYVVTFLEQQSDYFNKIKERIKNNSGRITKLGPDYLNYTVLDYVIDNYYLLIDKLGYDIDKLEEAVASNPTKEQLSLIHKFKGVLIYINRLVKPLRDIVRRLETEKSPLIKETTYEYLRDLYDHVVQVTDMFESYRETLTVILDIFITSQGNKLNEVMKVLTIIATIFIPITFIAGVYGMNFRFMPELGWHYGYYLALFLMIAIVIGMLIYFKRKKWF